MPGDEEAWEMNQTPTKIIDKDGTVRYKDSAGELHREDGPAIEHPNGSKSWWLHGKFHREDGPAIEYASGTKYWYLHGKRVNEETFEHILTCPLEDLPEYLGTEYECLAKKRLGR